MRRKSVIMISPGYPAEMPEFTKGLAACGARVYGIGDQPENTLPEDVRKALCGYLQVNTLWDNEEVVAKVNEWKGMATIHRVECLWEPGMYLAARLREAFGAPGLTVDQTIPFRNKSAMKEALNAHRIRTPRYQTAHNAAEVWDAAAIVGYPLIVKPTEGAGSADTYHVRSEEDLRAILPRLSHVHTVSVEEYIDGDEYTFDTICLNGEIVYYNVAWYRPRPLIARTNEWVSPQVIALRDLEAPHLQDGIKMGHDVIKALGFNTGFTHMEWFRKADGEVVFGEIAARPPGAHQVDQMNYACDIDVYSLWAQAIVKGTFDAEIQRNYNVATVYKRAQGYGTIKRIEGGQAIIDKYGDRIVWDALLPVGSQRRNWRFTLVSDGFVMLRDEDLDTTLKMADDVGSNLHIYAE